MPKSAGAPLESTTTMSKGSGNSRIICFLRRAARLGAQRKTRDLSVDQHSYEFALLDGFARPTAIGVMANRRSARHVGAEAGFGDSAGLHPISETRQFL